MSHLSAERLAALVDETPTSAEIAHLASCADCTRERSTYSALVSLAAAESGRIGLPLSTWETLAPALAADGVIETGRPFRFRAEHSRRPWLQTAAAALLVAGGIAAGRYTAGAPVLPTTASTTVPAAPSDSAQRFASIEDARAAQMQSQTLYQAATAFLAQHDTVDHSADTPSAMRTRLAALDRVREATLRQLNSALPAGMRLTRY